MRGKKQEILNWINYIDLYFIKTEFKFQKTHHKLDDLFKIFIV